MSTTRPRICAATGKQTFVRHQDAAKELGSIPKAKQELAHVPQASYRCQHCRRWHLTSYTPGDVKQINQTRKLREKGNAPRK